MIFCGGVDGYHVDKELSACVRIYECYIHTNISCADVYVWELNTCEQRVRDCLPAVRMHTRISGFDTLKKKGRSRRIVHTCISTALICRYTLIHSCRNTSCVEFEQHARMAGKYTHSNTCTHTHTYLIHTNACMCVCVYVNTYTHTYICAGILNVLNITLTTDKSTYNLTYAYVYTQIHMHT